MMTSMLIDEFPFKKLPEKRLFGNTGFQGSFSMNFKRVNAGAIGPEDCREMKGVKPSLIDEPESTMKGEEIPPPPAASKKYPPPKIRKGVPVFRHFPPNMQSRNHVYFLKTGVEERLPLVDSKEKDAEQINDFAATLGRNNSKESVEEVLAEAKNLVHGESPSQLELSQNDESFGANESNSFYPTHDEIKASEQISEEEEKSNDANDVSIISFDDYQSMVARLKVREALNLFKELYKILSDEDMSKSKEKGSAWKIISKASMLLKHHKKWVNTNERLIGAVPGVVVGDRFQFRAELVMIGLHQQFSSGIDYLKKDGTIFAISIVSSGRYANETESSDSLTYSGQGGNPKTGSKEPEDQKLERGNLALKNSMEARTPVRVIQSYQSWKASSSRKSGTKMYVYDGLYVVTKCWQERGEYGKLVFKFQLNRITEKHKLSLGEASTTRPREIKLAHDRLVVDDISQGKEKIPIRVVNDIDDEKPPCFTYITNIIYPDLCESSTSRSCDCINGCSDFVQCSCVVKNGGEVPFNDDGAIVKAKPIIYECGPFCKCPPSCKNRVGQRGIRYELEVFKTQKRGWGVRSRNFIPSGGFICEYIGEVLGDNEADDRAGNDEYLFDIGNNYGKRANDNDFAIDAAHLGNIGRFINHSCSPNLYAQNVFYDHDDKRMPHVMLFATKNIKPLQELNYDYNYKMDQVYDANGNIKRKDCYCGARCCTGRLY